ncbi:transmembrane 9 superfamily member 1 [Olea europaea subsp. europaea]|uniref:Transmembrane 9 superfamily member n=1 Tax=Olea europaea subsp. europaea TaxID=158383 RepID=A0A8S0R6P6_OLEEU|nr:transmembrane 9 superfamily member 1 [Olea europaea subsp. europaea]
MENMLFKTWEGVEQRKFSHIPHVSLTGRPDPTLSLPVDPNSRRQFSMVMLPTDRSSFSLVAFFCLLLLIQPALASDYDHKNDPVILCVNKVGPYNNPQETYNYYSLPFCRPDGQVAHKWGGLGEVLGGNELIDSLIGIKFQKLLDRTKICELELDEANIKQFKDAIENNYWFEHFIVMDKFNLYIECIMESQEGINGLKT